MDQAVLFYSVPCVLWLFPKYWRICISYWEHHYCEYYFLSCTPGERSLKSNPNVKSHIPSRAPVATVLLSMKFALCCSRPGNNGWRRNWNALEVLLQAESIYNYVDFSFSSFSLMKFRSLERRLLKPGEIGGYCILLLTLKNAARPGWNSELSVFSGLSVPHLFRMPVHILFIKLQDGWRLHSWATASTHLFCIDKYILLLGANWWASSILL